MVSLYMSKLIDVTAHIQRFITNYLEGCQTYVEFRVKRSVSQEEVLSSPIPLLFYVCSFVSHRLASVYFLDEGSLHEASSYIDYMNSSLWTSVWRSLALRSRLSQCLLSTIMLRTWRVAELTYDTESTNRLPKNNNGLSRIHKTGSFIRLWTSAQSCRQLIMR